MRTVPADTMTLMAASPTRVRRPPDIAPKKALISSLEWENPVLAQMPMMMGMKTATVPELERPAERMLERIRIATIIMRSVLAKRVTCLAIISHTPVSICNNRKPAFEASRYGGFGQAAEFFLTSAGSYAILICD